MKPAHLKHALFYDAPDGGGERLSVELDNTTTPSLISIRQGNDIVEIDPDDYFWLRDALADLQYEIKEPTAKEEA